MANTYKNIVITPNIGNTSDPKIVFSGANSTVNTDVTLYVYPASNGTLSFEGTSGQLFSITNDLSNSLFSVSDISGIPSLEIYANSLISVAPFGGNVGIGNSSPADKLSVNGTVFVNTSVSVGNSSVNTVINSTSFSGTANNALYLGGVAAANVISNAQFQANLANYAPLAGATFTGNVNINASANVSTDLNVGRNLVVTGNLTVSGNVTVIGANNLSVVDNMIYMNANNTVANPDLGFAGNYNDGTYRHAGFFRDASDAVWKVFDSYLPEPDASPYIDTTNSSFRIANFQANTVYVGNTSVYSTINTTSFTGTANNATYAYGKQEANLNVNSALYLSGTAANGYQTTAGLSANVVTLTSNNATYINGNTVLTVMESLRANRNITGGGDITVDGSYNVYWNQRFLVLANGRGSHFSTAGYFEIACPTSGTITGVGGASNRTATAAGIGLAGWEALYYIMPIGSNEPTVNANFRVATFTSDLEIPSNWVLICWYNADTSNIYFNNGIILKAGQTYKGSTSSSIAIGANTFTIGTASYFVANGNLGIGTSSPGAQLSVTSTSFGLANFNGPEYAQIRQTDGTRVLFTQVFNNCAVVGSETSTPLALFTNNTERMRIDASGNVGIGNTAPTHKLSINGTTYLGGVATVTGNLTIATTSGLIISNGAGIYANGSLGTANQVLSSNGSSVYWATPSAGGFSNGQSISVNNFVVTGAFTANSSNGSLGQVLTSNGSGVYWSSATGPRVSSTTTTTSPFSWNSDNFEQYAFTALANALTINADSGTATDGRKIIFRFLDNGTGQALTWTTGSAGAFRAVGVSLPTTTVANKVMYVGCIYNSNASRWDVISLSVEA